MRGAIRCANTPAVSAWRLEERGSGVERETWIPGCGLITSLGADLDTQWPALADSAARADGVDSESLAPFHHHRMVELDLVRWIPRKPEQRSVENTDDLHSLMLLSYALSCLNTT